MLGSRRRRWCETTVYAPRPARGREEVLSRAERETDGGRIVAARELAPDGSGRLALQSRCRLSPARARPGRAAAPGRRAGLSKGQVLVEDARPAGIDGGRGGGEKNGTPAC